MTRDEARSKVTELMQLARDQGHFSGRYVAVREAKYAAYAPLVLNNFRGLTHAEPWPRDKQEELAKQAQADLQSYRTAIEVGTLLLRREGKVEPALAEILIRELEGKRRPMHRGRYPRSLMFYRNYAIYRAVGGVYPSPMPTLNDAFVLIADVLRDMNLQPNTARTIEEIYRKMKRPFRAEEEFGATGSGNFG